MDNNNKVFLKEVVEHIDLSNLLTQMQSINKKNKTSFNSNNILMLQQDKFSNSFYLKPNVSLSITTKDKV